MDWIINLNDRVWPPGSLTMPELHINTVLLRTWWGGGGGGDGGQEEGTEGREAPPAPRTKGGRNKLLTSCFGDEPTDPICL